MIIALDHVQITIPHGAEEEAKRFYCGQLGLTEIEKPDSLKPNGGFWLKLGAVEIHIGCEAANHRANTKAHLAYEVADLPAWREKFERLGIVVRENTPIPNVARFDIRDPFGNRMEFLEREGK